MGVIVALSVLSEESSFNRPDRLFLLLDTPPKVERVGHCRYGRYDGF